MQHFGDDNHLMGCYEALWDDFFLYIVMEYLAGQDFFWQITWANRDEPPAGGLRPRAAVPAVARRLVENLLCLANERLVHCDLKPENIMMNGPWFPFIDFAQTLRVDSREQLLLAPSAGSESYISPERYRGRPFNIKADVWALGSILFNLFTGWRFAGIPLAELDRCYEFFIIERGLSDEVRCNQTLQEYGPNRDDFYYRILAMQQLDAQARDLLQWLMEEDPEERPDVNEILDHPFFAMA